MTLAEFLLARVAEDEATARAVPAPQWTAETARRPGVAMGLRDKMFEVGLVRGAFIDSEDPEGWVSDAATCDHAARWDPDRVLAECDAKRRVIELHTDHDVHECVPTMQVWPDLDTIPEVPIPCPTLRLLALPYADHPSFEEAWKP